MKSQGSSSRNILVVDDQVDIRTTIQFLLNNKGFNVWEAESPEHAKSIIKSVNIDMVITDMNFQKDTTSGKEGLEFVSYLKQHHPKLTVLVMTAWSTVSIAVQAMQLGARDFIEKPWENSDFYDIVERQINLSAVSSHSVTGSTEPASSEIIAESESFNQVLEKVKKVAMSHASVLLTGENGTGKSLLAHFIHQSSGRNNEPFVTVNLGAVPEQLFESELFGHKRGAFTGAIEDRKGRISLAGKGSLFLDELATTSMANQAKLLRVLETKEFEAVGGSSTDIMGCRLISATNANIVEEIKNQTFREDLYYRLNTIEINIPALRERGPDIIPLAHHYLHKIGVEYGKPELKLSSTAKEKLQAYQWPGNTRELKHVIERAVIFSDSATIESSDLALSLDTSHQVTRSQIEPLAKVEEALIIQALKQSNGNINVSAEMLGISRSALYRRIEKHGVKLKNSY